MVTALVEVKQKGDVYFKRGLFEEVKKQRYPVSFFKKFKSRPDLSLSRLDEQRSRNKLHFEVSTYSTATKDGLVANNDIGVEIHTA